MQRFTPVSPTKSVMRYEVYRHKDATDEAFNLISDMYKRIMSEDKVLCLLSQKNLNGGVFVTIFILFVSTADVTVTRATTQARSSRSTVSASSGSAKSSIGAASSRSSPSPA